MGAVPSVQQLLEMSLVSSDLKFEEVCSFLRLYCKLDDYLLIILIKKKFAYPIFANYLVDILQIKVCIINQTFFILDSILPYSSDATIW